MLEITRNKYGKSDYRIVDSMQNIADAYETSLRSRKRNTISKAFEKTTWNKSEESELSPLSRYSTINA